MLLQDGKSKEPSLLPSAHARSQPFKQVTWWRGSKILRLWVNISEEGWGMWRWRMLELQSWCIRHDGLAFKTDTVPDRRAVTALQTACTSSSGHNLKEGRSCRNCLPECLTLQLCMQLNTQISQKLLAQTVRPAHLNTSRSMGLSNSGARRKLIYFTSISTG